MIFNEHDVPVIICVFTKEKCDIDFVRSFFKDEKIDIEQDERDKEWITYIENSNIDRENLYKFLADLAKVQSFELTIDSDSIYICERYEYKTKDDFITKYFVDGVFEDGSQCLINSLFNESSVIIKLSDLV